MSQKANKRLISSTFIYMIGNMGSKLLQILILPIVTSTLTTSEYGKYDLIITTANLVVPLVTLQIQEGMFRYFFHSSEKDRKKIVSSSLLYDIVCCTVLLFGFIVFSLLRKEIVYSTLIYFNFVSLIGFEFLQKLSRCEQDSKAFAISGLVNTFSMLILQVVVLTIFHMGVDGMLIANCISYFIASLYLISVTDIKKWVVIDSYEKNVLKRLLLYSIPLAVNSLAWWIMASSDKFLISYFIGSDANGIYSIASKFPQMLTLLVSVFQLSWQENAIIEENSKDRDIFYSNTFNIYLKLLMSAFLVVLPFIRLIMPSLVDETYFSGFIYIPLLLLGAIFSAFSQFYGSAYLVFNRTRGVLSTTIAGAVINLLISISFISKMGLFAPALGTIVAFLFQWLIRAHQLRDCFLVKINVPMLLLLIILDGISIVFYYVTMVWVQVVAIIIGIIIFYLLNKSMFFKIIQDRIRKTKG